MRLAVFLYTDLILFYFFPKSERKQEAQGQGPIFLSDTMTQGNDMAGVWVQWSSGKDSEQLTSSWQREQEN